MVIQKNDQIDQIKQRLLDLGNQPLCKNQIISSELWIAALAIGMIFPKSRTLALKLSPLFLGSFLNRPIGSFLNKL